MAKRQNNSSSGATTVEILHLTDIHAGEKEYLDQDNKANLRKIKVSQSVDGRSVVDEGLTPGQRVITSGQYRVQPGSLVSTAIADSAQAPAKVP